VDKVPLAHIARGWARWYTRGDSKGFTSSSSWAMLVKPRAILSGGIDALISFLAKREES
jgi:hypothetical protein